VEGRAAHAKVLRCGKGGVDQTPAGVEETPEAQTGGVWKNCSARA
jgi:hypothetical protein